VQEHHDLAHDLLLGPGGNNPLGPHRPNAVDLSEPIGLGLDDTLSAKERTSFLA
jgi:hypothetical protein